ncbi:hypothetical protein C8Q79DRAFT_130476 [Trametes meyenii]|nr:hypothetical protein C8Q79DRAFT_130476 [Trametes meyenii]
MCWSNPLLLDDPRLASSAPPLDTAQCWQARSIHPLPDLSELAVSTLNTLVERPTGVPGSARFRIRIHEETRALKLVRCNINNSEESYDLSAYARFSHFGTWKSGAVARCYGTLSLDADVFKRAIAFPDSAGGTRFSDSVRRDVLTHELAVVHGIVLEDIELYTECIAHMYCMEHSRHSCPEYQERDITRASHLDELARCSNLAYARLIPDATIGHSANENSLDP